MVGEERAYLGGVRTRGFQTRYGFCFFQLHGGYEKAEPVPGSFHASILSSRRLTSFANVGLSETQLVPSCDVYNAFVMLYNASYADNLSQNPPCIVVF